MGIRVLIWALAVCRLVPFAVSQILLGSTRYDSGAQRREKIMIPGTLLNLMGNGAAGWLVTAAAFLVRNPVPKIREILQARCTYQDVATLAMTVPVCLAAGIIGGYILRALLWREDRLRITRGRRAAVWLLALGCAAAVLAGRSAALNSRKALRLTEICRKAEAYLLTDRNRKKAGEDGNNLCYAVVYNDGELDCALEALWLSETEEEPKACGFQQITVPAKGTLMLTMDANHGLDLKKGGGSTVFLSDADGELLDRVKVPALEENQCWTLGEDGTWSVRTLGNPVREKNPSGAYVPEPEFSAESGFYAKPFQLTIRGTEGTTVRYTLDCGEPTKESPVYTDPIAVYDRSEEPNLYRSIRNVQNDYLNKRYTGWEPVEKAFVVRAAAFDAEGNASLTVTKTYFIGLEQYREKNVLSLVADPADLFDPENGIYVTGAEYEAWYAENIEEATKLNRAEAEKVLDENGNRAPSIWDSEPTANFQQTGRAWEREADFTLLEQGEVFLSQPVGIRIQGHGTRRAALKRFSIYSRSEYSGSRYFSRQLFGHENTHSLVLREGELNALAQSLAAGRDVLAQPYLPVTVFLNGEYWYTTYLYEKATERLISNLYGVSEGVVTIVKNGEVPADAKKEENAFPGIYEYLRNHDLADAASYEGFGRIVDIQSYIDAACFQVYLANMDYQEQWNNYYWHTNKHEDGAGGDTRWRLGLYDMDLKWTNVSFSAKVEHAWEIDPFTMYGTWQRKVKTITEWPVFSALKKNPAFQRQFVLTFMDLVNTAFRPENVLPVLEAIGCEDKEVREFFENRGPLAAGFMAEAFGLTGTRETVTLELSDPAGGTVRINTAEPEMADGVWSGEYYTDYPVAVSAATREGYTFQGWEVNGEAAGAEAAAEIPVTTGGVTVRAVFAAAEGEER